jgi:hypothetical protein
MTKHASTDVSNSSDFVHPISLLLPEDEAVLVQMNRYPIICANQAHPVGGRYCEAATIAGLSEAESVP